MIREYFEYARPELTTLTRLAVIAKGQVIPSTDVTEPEPEAPDEEF